MSTKLSTKLTFVVKLKICLTRTSAMNPMFRSSLLSLSEDLKKDKNTLNILMFQINSKLYSEHMETKANPLLSWPAIE